MEILSLRAFIRVRYLIIWLGLSVGFPAGAQNTELPSSPNKTGGDWTIMRVSSFEATVESARTQCERTAAVDNYDVLTSEKCELLYAKLNAPQYFAPEEQCVVVMVSDGITFDFMNGRINGHSGVTKGVTKKLGRSDKATLCSLGDNLYAYWFIDDPGKSCNNVGFVIIPPQPIVAKEKTKTCRFVKREVVQLPSSFVHVPDMHTCGCVIPGYTGMVPGGIQTSSSLVCE